MDGTGIDRATLIREISIHGDVLFLDDFRVRFARDVIQHVGKEKLLFRPFIAEGCEFWGF